MKAEIIVNKNYVIGDIDNRLYGSFLEHVGRAIYGGIYEPLHPQADDMGFRKDVMELVKKLNVPIVRYPGGNFLSAYNWEDGIGDKAQRPQKLDLAWKSIETNQVGIDEFQEWAKRANTQVMMAVNLGTRGVDDARNCLEYCNCDTDTYYAQLRKQNGFEKPFGIKTWCLGNEMGGVWQICRKTPEEYGRLAVETAKVMKLVDSDIELVACGSSHKNMPRFGEWELTVLDHTYEVIDYLSIHQYFASESNETADFLGKSVELDKYIKAVAAMCDAVKAKKHSDKTINLSFDEWNVFADGLQITGETWEIAPHRFEYQYSLKDALVVGCMMMTLQNNCDRVKIACLAQLVNAIAPIMTENGGLAWVQTTYYPFMYASAYGRGETMRPVVKCDKYDTKTHKNIPYLECSVVHNPQKRQVTIFTVNRSLKDKVELKTVFQDFGECVLKEHIELYSPNLDAVNNKEKENVRPVSVKISDKSDMVLKKHSWNMLRFEY